MRAGGAGRGGRSFRPRPGTDAIKNLMLLCPNCHTEQHDGYGRYGGSSR
ncbi:MULTISPECIES: HNH endonuclease [Rubrivirga]